MFFFKIIENITKNTILVGNTCIYSKTVEGEIKIDDIGTLLIT
jgi:hypothetical protein